MYEPIEVTFTDPRTFDGNPYEVAARSLAQAQGILDVYKRSLETAMLMTRNSYMERNIANGNPPAGDAYAGSAEASYLQGLLDAADDAKRKLSIVSRSASYDPRHPPKG